MRSSSCCPAPRRKIGRPDKARPTRLPRPESSLQSLTHVTDSSVPITPENRAPAPSAPAARDLNDRLLSDLIDAVKGILRKEQSDRLRDVYLIGDIEKDTA